MIHDLSKCDIGADADVVNKWAERNPNIIASATSLGKNLLFHGLGMTSKAMFAVTDINAGHYYDFGHDLGWIVGRILADGNK